MHKFDEKKVELLVPARLPGAYILYRSVARNRSGGSGRFNPKTIQFGFNSHRGKTCIVYAP